MRNSFPFGIAVLRVVRERGTLETLWKSAICREPGCRESYRPRIIDSPRFIYLWLLFLLSFRFSSFSIPSLRNFNINNNCIVVLLQSHWRLNDEQNFHATLEVVIVICTGNHFHSRRGEIVIEKNTALENFTFESVPTSKTTLLINTVFETMLISLAFLALERECFLEYYEFNFSPVYLFLRASRNSQQILKQFEKLETHSRNIPAARKRNGGQKQKRAGTIHPHSISNCMFPVCGPLLQRDCPSSVTSCIRLFNLHTGR